MLHWWDSFDGYAVADLPFVYDFANSNGFAFAGLGRNGTGGYGFNGGSAQQAKKAMSGSPATVGQSFGFLRTTLSGVMRFAGFLEGGSYQVMLGDDGSNHLRVWRGQGTAVLGTGTKVINDNTYYHIEWKVTIHPSAGTIVVKVNGVVDINLSGLNTRATANSWADQASIGPDTNFGLGGGYVGHIDDYIVWDTTGAAPWNDFPGDCRVQCLNPSADGASSAWTPNSGTTHFNRVNEATQDGDTTYLSDANVGDRDTWTFTDLTPTSGSVLGVAVVAVARKDDAGARSIVTVERQSGVNYDNATVHPLGTTYTYERDNMTLNPATSAQFTVAEVNAGEWGVKVNA